MDRVLKFRVLGITDERTSCDCCGKTPLKSTTAVEMLDTGEIQYFGSTCVTRNTGMTAKQIKDELAAAERAKLEVARAEYATHPARAAMDARIAEAHAANITPGAPFMNYVKDAHAAAQSARIAIAERHKVDAWKVL